MRPVHPAAGTWTIKQVASVSDLQTAAGDIRRGLDTDGVVGFSPRIPANAILADNLTSFDDRILAAALELVAAFGKMMVPRIIWGRYTPQATKAAGGVITVGGVTAPRPFTSAAGAPNTAFEDAQDAMNGHLVTQLRDLAVTPGFHGGWHSFNYSELYLGATQGGVKIGVQALFGLPLATIKRHCIDAWKRLMRNQYEICSGVGAFSAFGLSGHGPIDGVTDELAAYVVELAGPHASLLMVNANGWNPGGEWGGALEPVHDRDVYSKPVNLGAQDIHPANGGPRSDADYDRMFDNLDAIDADTAADVIWTELYAEQWVRFLEAGALARMTARIAKFYFDRLVEDPPPPPGDCEKDLAAARAEITDLQTQLVGALTQAQEANAVAVQRRVTLDEIHGLSTP